MFAIWISEFGVWYFGDWNFEFIVLGFEFGFWGLEIWSLGFRFLIWILWFGVWNFEFCEFGIGNFGFRLGNLEHRTFSLWFFF